MADVAAWEQQHGRTWLTVEVRDATPASVSLRWEVREVREESPAAALAADATALPWSTAAPREGPTRTSSRRVAHVRVRPGAVRRSRASLPRMAAEPPPLIKTLVPHTPPDATADPPPVWFNHAPWPHTHVQGDMIHVHELPSGVPLGLYVVAAPTQPAGAVVHFVDTQHEPPAPPGDGANSDDSAPLQVLENDLEHEERVAADTKSRLQHELETLQRAQHRASAQRQRQLRKTAALQEAIAQSETARAADEEVTEKLRADAAADTAAADAQTKALQNASDQLAEAEAAAAAAADDEVRILAALQREADTAQNQLAHVTHEHDTLLAEIDDLQQELAELPAVPPLAWTLTPQHRRAHSLAIGGGGRRPPRASLDSTRTLHSLRSVSFQFPVGSRLDAL